MLKKHDMTAGEIAGRFDISKPSISHHLNTLKQAGMVLDERKGQYIYYSINTSVFEDVVSFGMELSGRKEPSPIIHKPPLRVYYFYST